MLNEAPPRDAASESATTPAADRPVTSRASRRLVLGGSLAALGLAAGSLPRLSPVSPAAAQGAPAAAPPKGPQPFEDGPDHDEGERTPMRPISAADGPVGDD